MSKKHDRSMLIIQISNHLEQIPYTGMIHIVVKNNLFFNGSTDVSLNEQLKGLYLKQEFTQFAYDNQGKDAKSLQQAFQDFVKRTQPSKPKPTWLAGSLGKVVSA